MYSEKSVCLFVSQYFNEAFSVVVGFGAGVGDEWEFTNFVGDFLLFQLFFSLANPSDFWMSVDNRWDTIIVNVDWTSANSLNSDDSFIFSFVSQHGSFDDVSDGIDSFGWGLEFGVDWDTATLIELDSDVFETEVATVWTTADSDKENVTFKLKNNIVKD